jgi:hypothetical protein
MKMSLGNCRKIMGGPVELKDDCCRFPALIGCVRRRFHRGPCDSGWVSLSRRLQVRRESNRVVLRGTIGT